MSAFTETVTYGKPSAPSQAQLPFITIASVQASIDKAYLTWLEISKLQMAFPERVELVGDSVVFQGPVAIFPPLNLTKRFMVQSFGGIAVGSLFLIIFGIYALSISKGSRKVIPLSQKLLIVVCGSLVCCGAIAGFYATGRCFPTPGVYFSNYSSFIP